MFNINYLKAEPTTYVLKYRKGKVVSEGAGLSFYYYAPSTTVVAIPLAAQEANFMFRESSKDYQEVTIQGAVTYKVTNPVKLSESLNYALSPDGKDYASEDPKKLETRMLKLVQVSAREAVQKLNLVECLQETSNIDKKITQQLVNNEMLTSLGITLLDISILAIKPNPDTQRALEATIREQLLLEADEAIYVRRNAAVHQERTIKENELETERAIEQKQQEMREAEIAAEQRYKSQLRDIEQEEIEGKVELEKRNNELVDLTVENAKKEADAKAYGLEAAVNAFKNIDPKNLEALALAKMTPEQLMAQAFKELANNSGKIGQLNITPDLLESIIGRA